MLLRSDNSTFCIASSIHYLTVAPIWTQSCKTISFGRRGKQLETWPVLSPSYFSFQFTDRLFFCVCALYILVPRGQPRLPLPSYCSVWTAHIPAANGSWWICSPEGQLGRKRKTVHPLFINHLPTACMLLSVSPLLLLLLTLFASTF